MRERRKDDFAPDQDRNSADDADDHADLGTDPVVLERVFEKVRRADEHRGDADAVQPMRADEALEIALRRFGSFSVRTGFSRSGPIKVGPYTPQRRESRFDRREPPLEVVHTNSV